MTITNDPVGLGDGPLTEDGALLQATARLGAGESTSRDEFPLPPAADEVDGEEAADDERQPSSAMRATIVSSLGSAAAAWMIAGPFGGMFPKLVAVSAVAVAACLLAASFRSSRGTALQLAGIPGAVVVAVAWVMPTGVAVSGLPDLVLDSLRQGGLSSPPVPFDPGWRVLLVLLAFWLTLTSGTIAVALDRPRLGVVVPGAVALVGMLLQPPGGELVSVVVALVLVISALAVAYGSDLARESDLGSKFELRRMARAGGIATSLVVAMIALSQFGLLLPEAEAEQVIPPQRPQIPPPPQDRVLFTAETEQQQIPWRVGVLDVFRDNAWMTPPFDPRLLVDLDDGKGVIADAIGGGEGALGAVVEAGETYTTVFRLEDVEGRAVPVLPGAVSVEGGLSGLEYDPRTQTLRVGGHQPGGTSYTVVAALPPDAARMAAAPEPDRAAAAIAEFLEAPTPGPVASQLVTDALALDASLFEQLQFVRETFYDKVIAAGKGNPSDVPPGRVEQILNGSEATPYEIVAAEALLARWLGVPARIGYGYYGGDLRGDRREIRPKHGALWLEVYFEGLGWTPIVGRPPRARSSLQQEQTNDDPQVRPTDEIAAQVYVPTLGTSLSPVFVLVRYWLVRVAPLVLGSVALFGGYPALLKPIRRWRRRRWAERVGPRGRIAAAYAEIRDVANDLNIGHPTLTPIEFLDALEPDSEHRELAWLVTRTMWGDLQRDATEADAVAAEDTGRSLRKRLVGGQPFAVRVLGAVSRVSLRQPFEPDMPNLWWSTRAQHQAPRTSAVAAVRRWSDRISERRRLARVWRNRLRRRLPPPLAVLVGARLPRLRLRVLLPLAIAALVLASIVMTGGVREVDLASDPSAELPPVPTQIASFQFEPFAAAQEAFESYGSKALISDARLYGIRHEGVVVGTLQQSSFKPGPRSRARSLHRGVLEGLRMGSDDLVRLSGERVYVRRLPEQTEYLWLAPDLSTMQLLVASRDLEIADTVFSALLATQRGEALSDLDRPVDTPPIDPRRRTP